MRIAILHPAVAAEASLEDQDTLIQVQTVADALERLGHEAVRLPCTLDLSAVRDALQELKPAVVFNLVESVDGADSLQYVPPAVLDALAIPYTGAPTEAIFQTTHKLLAKQLLHLAGLPTPRWMVHRPGEAQQERARVFGGSQSTGDAPGEPTVWIVKAVWEHASRGLEEQNLVSDGGNRVWQRMQEHAARSGRPCFAEEFIEGREFNLSILEGPAGPEVLPAAEIDFSAFPPDKPRIVGHRAKWEEGSFEFHNTPRRFDFLAKDRPLLDRLRQLSRECWELFALRGYARVDFRVDRRGQPWILEINTNPCLSPDAGFAAAVARAGIDFDEAIRRILGAVGSPDSSAVGVP
jgi:D-alanine-D-alanine ligase